MGRIILFTFIIVMAIGCAASAQTTTATLLGVVRDTSGAVMPNVQITAQNVQTSLTRKTSSDAQGNYLIPGLPIGQYRLIAEAPGFEKFIQNGIILAVDQNARVDVTLRVGATSQTVQVTAESTGVDTHSAAVGELVDPSRMQELPLNGRNAMTLAEVVPGVTSILAAPTVQTESRVGPQIVIEGGRDTENEYRFDDAIWKNMTYGNAVNLPNPDALQEFEVLTSNYSAEYGREAGGVIVAVTRSGTNQFHGTLWEYLRNTDLDARNFFSSGVPQLIQNQYGFTFGGPAIKDKLFFFGSFQGTKIRQSTVFSSATPPTAAEMTGDFSALTTTIKNPATGQAFPGNVIPSADFDPVAVRFMHAYMPLANNPNGTWDALVPNPTNDNQYLWRADYDASDKDTMMARFFDEGSNQRLQDGNIYPYDPNTYGFKTQGWVAHDTYSISPHLLNEAFLAVTRMNFVDGETNQTQLSDLGAIFPGVIIPELPTVSVSGYYNLSDDNLYTEGDNIYQLGDTLWRNKGKHSMMFGGEIQRLEYYGAGYSSDQGNFSFDGSQSGNAFADFLLGKAVTMTQKSPYVRNAKTWNWSLFAQDDIRLTQRLTVDLGLRYELFRPFQIDGNALHTNTYRAGEQSTIVPSAPLGMVFPGDPGIINGLVPDDWHNFGPRVGLAWDPFGNGRMSIRAGYALIFDDQRSDIWTYPAVNQPFEITDTINTPASFQDPYLGYHDPFPYIYSPQNAKFAFPMSLFTVPNTTLPTPYDHDISFTIQKALPHDMVLNVGYVGKLTHNGIRMLQENPAKYIPGDDCGVNPIPGTGTSPCSTLGNTNARRILLPNLYSSFRLEADNANSSFNALQISLNHRYHNGLTVLTSFTWSKFLDFYTAENLGQTPQDPFDADLDRGRSDEDREAVLNASFVYELPFLKNRKGVIGTSLGGWSLSGIVGAGSGLPVLIESGQDFSLTGVDYDRPNVVGNMYLAGNRSTAQQIREWFNTAAFVANSPGQYGDAPRNPLSGPGEFDTDLSLVKSFPIGEKYGRMQVRAEVFNTFNNTNFGQPDGTFVDSTFGRILTAGNSRVMQFALRYQF